jgi:hypothetical protein
MSSYKTEVCVDGGWSTNALRFATAEEADAYGKELLSRWWVPSDHRAAPSDDPVNYRFDFTANRAVSMQQEVAS